MDRTKVVAYADDLIMATKGEPIRAVENYTNVELSKIHGVHARVKICVYLCIFQVLFVYSIASSDAIFPPPAWHLKG